MYLTRQIPLRYRTKGDANDAEDGELIHYRNVIGTPVFSIPYLGYMADYIQHPPGMYVAISAGAVLLLLIFLPDLLADDEKRRENARISCAWLQQNDSTSDEKCPQI